ncbi:MAG TPA: tricarboxylate transporter [Deltaproteobacteria bacterium]|nr:tricarboxylate transporter [Deltaproteobacteria bacterium]
MRHTKVLGTLIFVLCAGFLAVLRPFSGLPDQGHYVCATVLVALGLWIFRPGNVPYFAGAATLICGALFFGLPLEVVTGGFTSSGVWVLIPALYLGYALAKTGLGKRIAYFVLKSFRPTYFTIIVSWFIIGLVLSALTPSITVRLSVVMPIAMNLVEACRLADRSRGSALICLVAWGTAVLPGTGWLTGSLWGPFMLGFLPPEMKPLATFDMWFKIMAVPWFIITILFVGLIYILLKPRAPLAITQETFRKQYHALGKISVQEIITGIILAGALALFATERYHHVSTAACAMTAVLALILFQVITFSEIRTGVNWDIIVFFGVVVSLSGIFTKAEISGWIRPFVEPAVLSLAQTPLTFLIVITLGFWLIRFIDVPWGFSTIALTSPLFIPLFVNFGLHPVLVSVAVIAAGNSLFLAYTQPFIMISDTITQSRGWSARHVALGGGAYAVSVVISILISSIYWKAIHVLP